MSKNTPLAYVLITPARNEEGLIEKTIQSVICQTVLPLRWVVVSDGSTDRTDEIVRKYISRHSWIELIRRPVHDDRQFAAKVHSFRTGYEQIRGLEFDVIGNLDADLSFEQDYIEYLLNKFLQDPALGVGGTPFVEDAASPYDYRYTNIEHVSGACQLFRRTCFESIGGYIPIKGGGIDWVAVTMARMKGWKTQTFTDKCIYHHRKMGTGNSGILHARFSQGQQDYFLGNHPLWQIFRAIYQVKHKPYFLGGLFLLSGYILSVLQRQKRPVPAELVTFIRHEQMERLRAKVRSQKSTTA